MDCGPRHLRVQPVNDPTAVRAPGASPEQVDPLPAQAPVIVAAPDKFRGTAAASEVARAIDTAARRVGWRCIQVPLSDGGDGLLDVLGGERREIRVTGPLGSPVDAEWSMIGDPVRGATAVIEMARASGLLLAGGSEGNEPELASTRGTGELIAAAVASGVRRILVGCGGSATTDGGLGALEALAEIDLSGVDLEIAVDVNCRFIDAARVFGPQKGASPAVIRALETRLVSIANHYVERFGTDVRDLPGSGAAGGLAGGLVAIGGRLVPGFATVAALCGLAQALGQRPQLVVTGEGCFDETSLNGKVVGGLVELVAGRCPVLVVAGQTGGDVPLPGDVALISLAARFGLGEAFAHPLPLVSEVVVAHLRAPHAVNPGESPAWCS